AGARAGGRPGRPGGSAGVPRGLVPATELPGPGAFAPEASEVRLSRDELLAAAGLEPEQLTQLEQFGLIARRGKGPQYDGDALAIAGVAGGGSRVGIEPRAPRGYQAGPDPGVGRVAPGGAAPARARK